MSLEIRNIIALNECWAGCNGAVVNVFLNEKNKKDESIRIGIYIPEMKTLYINNKCPKSLILALGDKIARI